MSTKKRKNNIKHNVYNEKRYKKIENEIKIQIFPNEIFILIFSFFSYKNFVNLSLVCKKWNELIKLPNLWKNHYFDLSNNSKLNEPFSIIRLLEKKQFSAITNLCIGPFKTNNDIFNKLFQYCPNLKNIRILIDSGHSINGTHLTQIGCGNKNINGLSINSFGIIINDVTFSLFQRLEHLYIGSSSTKIKKLLLVLGKYCNKLKSVNLTEVDLIAAAYEDNYKFDHILNLFSNECKELEHLELNCYEDELFGYKLPNDITSEGIISLCLNCKNLISLKLSYCKEISDLVLTTIVSNCPKLKFLQLSLTYNESQNNLTKMAYDTLLNRKIYTYDLPLIHSQINKLRIARINDIRTKIFEQWKAIFMLDTWYEDYLNDTPIPIENFNKTILFDEYFNDNSNKIFPLKEDLLNNNFQFSIFINSISKLIEYKLFKKFEFSGNVYVDRDLISFNFIEKKINNLFESENNFLKQKLSLERDNKIFEEIVKLEKTLIEY